MAQSINVNIRLDEDLKKQAEQLFAEFGMNMTTACTVFLKAVIREQKIPFEISATPTSNVSNASNTAMPPSTAHDDDFYNPYNQARLQKTIAKLKAGEPLIYKSMEALEAMEQE